MGMEAQGWGVPLGLHQSHQPAGHLPAKAWPGPDHMPFITLERGGEGSPLCSA